MCRLDVTALIFLVAAAFVAGAHAQDDGLEELHQELALQLLEEEQAGVTGEGLAAKLQENLKTLNEIQREEETTLDDVHQELMLQLMEEEQAGVSGAELASLLREERRELTEMDRKRKKSENNLELRSPSCNVAGFTAKCCAGSSFKVFWKRVELNACIEATFLPEELGLQIKITAAGSTLYEKKVSVGNAGKVCVKVPKLRVVSVCLHLSNLQAEGGHFSGCLAMQPQVFGKTVKTINLGCISLP